MKHRIPRWTFVVTPIALLAMITTLLLKINVTHPEAVPMLLVLIAIGNAFVVISISHWIKAAIGGAK
jgi:hypothetical protein